MVLLPSWFLHQYTFLKSNKLNPTLISGHRQYFLDCQSRNLLFDDAAAGKYFIRNSINYKSLLLWLVSGYEFLAFTQFLFSIYINKECGLCLLSLMFYALNCKLELTGPSNRLYKNSLPGPVYIFIAVILLSCCWNL